MNNDYVTKDLYIAALLVANDLIIKHIQSREKTFLFVFDNVKAKELEDQFWNGTLEINAKKFVDSIHDLKARMRTLNFRRDMSRRQSRPARPLEPKPEAKPNE